MDKEFDQEAFDRRIQKREENDKFAENTGNWIINSAGIALIAYCFTVLAAS